MGSPYPKQLSQLDFYPVWMQAPALTDTVDPFSFEQRMAVYRLMVEATNKRGIFGADNVLNVFWGYVFQLQWQGRSGRLQFPDTPAGRIDPDSAWGFGNYALCLIPLVGAMQVGFIPELEVLPPDAPSRFEYVSGGSKAGKFQIPPLFQDAARAWQGYFKLVEQTQPGSDLEPIRFSLWNAHKASLVAVEHVLRRIEPLHTSRKELDFLIGWCRMVDYLWLAAWPTDLPFMLENGSGVLPERLIQDDDVPGQIPEMNTRTNNNVRNILNLATLSDLRFNFNLWLWKRAMRTRQARNEVVAMLDAVFNPSPENVTERRRLFRYTVGF
jgi:hypothetical protein